MKFIAFVRSIFRSTLLPPVIALLCISLAVVPTVGCLSQSTIASLTATLGTAAANIAKLQGNISLGEKLTVDTNAAVAAVTNWKSGTPAQEVIEALSLVEDDLDLFPGTSQYAPLIDLAIGTAQTLVAMLPVPATPTALTAHAHRQVHLSHAAPKSSKAFKTQWNQIAAQNPQLSAAAIR